MDMCSPLTFSYVRGVLSTYLSEACWQEGRERNHTAVVWAGLAIHEFLPQNEEPFTLSYDRYPVFPQTTLLAIPFQTAGLHRPPP